MLIFVFVFFVLLIVIYLVCVFSKSWNSTRLKPSHNTLTGNSTPSITNDGDKPKASDSSPSPDCEDSGGGTD